MTGFGGTDVGVSVLARHCIFASRNVQTHEDSQANDAAASIFARCRLTHKVLME